MIRFAALLFLVFMMAFPLTVSAQNSAAPVKEARFFSSMQDIPLVPGLEELRDQAVSFDKPEGRIIESVAEINTGTFDSVKKAYEETLPQLGWNRIAENSYARAGEFLHLNFEAYNGRNFLRVLVRPQDEIHN